MEIIPKLTVAQQTPLHLSPGAVNVVQNLVEGDVIVSKFW